MYLKEKLTIRKVCQTRKKAENEITLFTDLVCNNENTEIRDWMLIFSFK